MSHDAELSALGAAWPIGWSPCATPGWYFCKLTDSVLVRACVLGNGSRWIGACHTVGLEGVRPENMPSTYTGNGITWAEALSAFRKAVDAGTDTGTTAIRFLPWDVRLGEYYSGQIEPEGAIRLPATKDCGNCRFYEHDQCRRRSPNVATSWPVVGPEDWCGEWKIGRDRMPNWYIPPKRAVAVTADTSPLWAGLGVGVVQGLVAGGIGLFLLWLVWMAVEAWR